MCASATKERFNRFFCFITSCIVKELAPESMRENIKEEEINLFTDVVFSFNPVAE